MKKELLTIPFLLLSLATPAFAQEDATSSIAMVFDSPVFFWFVVGSGIIFFAGSAIFIFVIRKKEEAAVTWGKDKPVEELIGLLDSPVAEEAQQAQMCLVNQLKENDYPIVIKSLERQRDGGRASEKLIHLIEDLAILAALPVLESIARGKSKMAAIAADTITRMPVEEVAEK